MSRVSRRSLIKSAGATIVVGAPAGAAPLGAQTIGKGARRIRSRRRPDAGEPLVRQSARPSLRRRRGTARADVRGRRRQAAVEPDSRRRSGRRPQDRPGVGGIGMDDPNPDPGEEYPHVSTQLFGIVAPADNRYKPATSMSAPFNTPSPLPAIAPMHRVRHRLRQQLHANARPDAELRRIPRHHAMLRAGKRARHQHAGARVCGLRPLVLCDVPSQTFTNRSFFHAASSGGAVINEPFAHWARHNSAETIFERIEAKGLAWKVYFDEQDVFPLTALIHYPRLQAIHRHELLHDGTFLRGRPRAEIFPTTPSSSRGCS